MNDTRAMMRLAPVSEPTLILGLGRTCNDDEAFAYPLIDSDRPTR